MTQLSQEILALMRWIVDHPTLVGTPQAVSGQIEAYAAVVLKEELGGQLEMSVARALVTEATADVVREPAMLVTLDAECLIPEVQRSYDAIRRHGILYLDLLERHIERVRALALTETPKHDIAPRLQQAGPNFGAS